MKILIISDTHRNIYDAEWAVYAERPDMILHLGDLASDAFELADKFPHIPMYEVCGNCDFASSSPMERIIECEGKRILMTHGHKYGVKNSMLSLQKAAVESKVDAVLYGHTHKASNDMYRNIHIFNPGSAGEGTGKSYGVLETDGKTMYFRINRL